MTGHGDHATEADVDAVVAALRAAGMLVGVIDLDDSYALVRREKDGPLLRVSLSLEESYAPRPPVRPYLTMRVDRFTYGGALNVSGGNGGTESGVQGQKWLTAREAAERFLDEGGKPDAD